MGKAKQVSLEEVIYAIKKLYDIGIDINRIQRNDTIQSLGERYGVPVELFSLNSKFDEIGKKIHRVKTAYRSSSKSVRVPSKEEREELERMGLKFESEDTIQIFVDKMKLLDEHGVKINSLAVSDTVWSLVVEKSGLSPDLIDKLNLEYDDKIGKKKSGIAQLCRGKVKGNLPTIQQIEELRTLGLEFEILVELPKVRTSKNVEKNKRDTIQVFVDKMKLLAEHGVKIDLLAVNDTVESLVVKKSGLSSDLIDKLNLEYDDKIGKKKSSIAQLCRGKVKGNLPTIQQIEELRTLGLEFEILVELPNVDEVMIERENLNLDATVYVQRAKEQQIKQREADKQKRLKEKEEGKLKQEEEKAKQKAKKEEERAKQKAKKEEERAKQKAKQEKEKAKQKAKQEEEKAKQKAKKELL